MGYAGIATWLKRPEEGRMEIEGLLLQRARLPKLYKVREGLRTYLCVHMHMQGGSEKALVNRD